MFPFDDVGDELLEGQDNRENTDKSASGNCTI